MNNTKEIIKIKYYDVNGISHYYTLPDYSLPGDNYYSSTDGLSESSYIFALLKNNPELDKNMIYLIAKEISKDHRSNNINWNFTLVMVELHFYKTKFKKSEYGIFISLLLEELVDLKIHTLNIYKD